MFELLCEQAAAVPERAFATTVDTCISYTALEARARTVAQRLHRSGIRRGDRVGLLCDNRIEWLEVFFAAAAAALCAALAAVCLSRLAGMDAGNSTVEQPTSFDAKLEAAPTAGS